MPQHSTILARDQKLFSPVHLKLDLWICVYVEQGQSTDEIPDEVYDHEELVRWIGYSQLFTNAFSFVFKHAFPVCDSVSM